MGHEISRCMGHISRQGSHLCRALQPPVRLSSDIVTTRSLKPKGEVLRYVELEAERKERIDSYLQFLMSENQSYNLTGLKTLEDCVEQLVDDSSVLIPVIEENLELKEDVKLVDIGSGAGIPGLIFAVMRDQWKVCCIESSEKKADFISKAATRLGLSNVEVVRGRAEGIAHLAEYRESFDVAVARAVANLNVITEYCLPFVSLDGIFVAPKGPDIEVELKMAKNAISILGGELLNVNTVESFGALGQRKAVVIKKTKKTSKKYPRKTGLPSRRPL